MSRSGDWIATSTGRQWFLTDPHPDDVCIEDIAHALGMICRFGGHTRQFYSVAQHSVLVYLAVASMVDGASVALRLHALLHDAAEAYLGDMVRPLKQSMGRYKVIEHMTEAVIFEGLGVPPMTEADRRIVKDFDDVLLMTERRDLVKHCGIPWTPRAQPLEAIIRPWPSELAAAHFQVHFEELMKELAGGAV